MDEVFAGVEGSMDALDMSMTQLLDIIRSASAKLTTVIEQVEEVQDSGAMDILLNLLAGDPETFGEYFSQPVQVQENYIYSIKNYGSGVAPFYTTLAIWVGMTILVSLIKVHAEKEGLDNPRPYELFFGRYLIFLLLSEIQSTIIVLGDLYLLRIQCLYPFEFWLTAAVTSLTFSLVVYSLTIAFGDIGKAVAVVVMVIQIAGSGGTYPIEALPGFFQAVYIFLPFPYAIDAMRECIGGMYQNTYSVCLAQLGLFGVAALVVGLVIRIPFMGLNHFFEERMEDTKMM
jgi:putative membrane protein